MCNYCQTGTTFGNTGCGHTPWHVQRVWSDNCGNIHVVLSGGCHGHHPTCGNCECVGGNNVTTNSCNGHMRCCGGGTITTGNTTTQNLTTTQGCDVYYARQYGLYPYNTGVCSCGYGFISGTVQ